MLKRCWVMMFLYFFNGVDYYLLYYRIQCFFFKRDELSNASPEYSDLLNGVFIKSGCRLVG